jgi:hypothetical protein
MICVNAYTAHTTTIINEPNLEQKNLHDQLRLTELYYYVAYLLIYSTYAFAISSHLLHCRVLCPYYCICVLSPLCFLLW